VGEPVGTTLKEDGSNCLGFCERSNGCDCVGGGGAAEVVVDDDVTFRGVLCVVGVRVVV
jgi:hypothetical protein